MKLFSTGGKYQADPKPVVKKRKATGADSKVKTVPAVVPVPKKEAAPAAAPTPKKEATPAAAPAPKKEAAPAAAPAPKKEATPTVVPVPKKAAAPAAVPVPKKEAAPAAAPAPKKETALPAESAPVKEAIPAIVLVTEADTAPKESAAPVQEPVETLKNSHKDRTAAKQTKSKKRSGRNVYIALILIACLILAAVFGFLFVRKNRATSDFQQLAQQIQQMETAEPTAPPTTVPKVDDDLEISKPEETDPVETEPPVKTILPKYAGLYQENTEFFGWVRIDGTAVDYPVMRSHDDNEKYLYANFNGDYSYAGTPFVDIKCTLESDNLLIYGHNIRDGSMFHSLLEYDDEDYWKEHPTIMFSDLYEDYEYEIVAAFYDRVYLKSDTCFKFYQFINAEDEADFDYAISQFKEKALYETGVDAEYGDQLITLITCAYHVENGRFVVVARRK